MDAAGEPGKNDLPISYFASAWLKVEGSDAIDDHRGSGGRPGP